MKKTYRSSYLKYLLLLPGDIELNPGPSQVINLWEPFDSKGLHFIHLNINSLLPKIDELRDIAKKVEATVIGITESKLDSSISDSEIDIAGYDVLS